MNTGQTYRRVRASVKPLHINLIHYSNPWVVVAWSFFCPGFGHILLGEYVLGWILFLWELGINVYTEFNTAIIDSFTGRFAEARHLLGEHHSWYILVYGGVFVFTLLVSYKLAVESNEIYYLANKENAPIRAFSINTFQFNYLNKRSPIIGALWSLVMPGLGGVWTHRVITATFELAWWVVIMVKSHLLAGIEYTALGEFHQAVSVLDPEWVMFVPSLYSFLFYYTYALTVEMNKLFDKEQANYLVQNYQKNTQFPLYLKDEVSQMRFIASFNHSIYLETAIANLESIGVTRDNVFVSPLDKRNNRSVWFDTMQRSDGKALLDGVALLGGVGCALGTIYGFVLTWGPVLWGLIGFFTGCLIGALFTLLKYLATSKSPERVPKTEVVVIVDCEDSLAKAVEDILWSNKAFGMSKIGHREAPV